MRYKLAAFVCLFALTSCDDGTTSGDANPGTHPYYPYQVGDEYVIVEWTNFTGDEFRDTIRYRVQDVVKFNGYSYYRVIGEGGLMYYPGHEPLSRSNDTTLFRIEGSQVITRSNIGEDVHIDFETPFQPAQSTDDPLRFLRDTTGVETSAGTFDGKMLRGNVISSQRHFFAPGVGLVKIVDSDLQFELLSATIGGVSFP